MLEIVNLSKTYTSKGGVDVLALNNISIRFASKGMVFIVGKSGCGKSTLLNVLGGLDSYDQGDIIINNSSTSSFKQGDFDSYRNTYVGFIFQEYNVLNDFNVGANIALALKLQGKKASDEQINYYLKKVDLEGYGNRLPNELSGGQKQRVAIARALIKEPEIILADEPSGALDSNSAKQVFDTLKELSKEKLVIIVSHDREFANIYADRIIELSDGNIINDLERISENEVVVDDSKSEEKIESVLYEGNKISVVKDYQLTQADLAKINEYLAQISNNCEISVNNKIGKINKFDKNFKKNTKVVQPNPNEVFSPIKSKIPASTAFKMGSSNLKLKPVRLVFTILLSLISFTMFGLYITVASFNKNQAMVNSLYDTKISYASFSKMESEENSLLSSTTKMNDEDIEKIEQESGIKVRGVYFDRQLSLSVANNVNLDANIDASDKLFNNAFSGFSEFSADDVKDYGFTVSGNLPQSDDEIVIPQFMAEIFLIYGYKEYNTENVVKISTADDLIGKTLSFTCIDGNKVMIDSADDTSKTVKTYKITGILSTNDDFSRYQSLAGTNILNGEYGTDADLIKTILTQLEYDYLLNYSFNTVIIANQGYTDRLLSVYNDYTLIEDENYMYISKDSGDYEYELYNIEALIDFDKIKDKITWIGSAKTSLLASEVIVSKDIYEQLGMGTSGFTLQANDRSGSKGFLGITNMLSYQVNIVGYFESELPNIACVCDELSLNYANLENSFYMHAVGKMPTSKSEISKLVLNNITSSDGKYCYNLVNHVTYYVNIVNSIITVFKGIFMFIGVINAIFAALLFGNFISVGITNKRQEIGILRAIGARSIDVFKIFFSESLLMALINFVASFTLTGIIVLLVNVSLKSQLGVLATVFSFGILQFISLLLISLSVAFVASIIPVSKFARKRPVDAIRGR